MGVGGSSAWHATRERRPENLFIYAEYLQTSVFTYSINILHPPPREYTKRRVAEDWPPAVGISSVARLPPAVWRRARPPMRTPSTNSKYATPSTSRTPPRLRRPPFPEGEPATLRQRQTGCRQTRRDGQRVVVAHVAPHEVQGVGAGKSVRCARPLSSTPRTKPPRTGTPVPHRRTGCQQASVHVKTTRPRVQKNGEEGKTRMPNAQPNALR